MEPETLSKHTWIMPGARLLLFSLGNTGKVHYAKPGEKQTLCGCLLNGYMARGAVEAVDGMIQARTASITRRVTAKTDCIRCIESYSTNMRKYK